MSQNILTAKLLITLHIYLFFFLLDIYDNQKGVEIKYPTKILKWMN